MSEAKATILGLYGIPGSGKTALLNELKKEKDLEDFLFFESSKSLDTVTSHLGGLDAFKRLPEKEKKSYRITAIKRIRGQCANTGKVGVVAGHFMFWNEADKEGHCVCTEEDLSTYTHILYLECDPKEIHARHAKDKAEKKREREAASVEHLEKWQNKESRDLSDRCRKRGILFSRVRGNRMIRQDGKKISSSSLPAATLVPQVKELLQDFRSHNSSENLSRVRKRLDSIVQSMEPKPTTVLVFDADRTLTAGDTGNTFWDSIPSENLPDKNNKPLKTLFSSPLGYSYDAFRQASLLYHEISDDEFYEDRCKVVASKVTLYPEFLNLMKAMYENPHVGMVIVTCGLQRVWEIVLEIAGLDRKVSVIGGGRISHGFVVTSAVKAALVVQLQTKYHMHVWAFGDSPLDLDMLKKADQAVVVVGSPESRSKTMDAELRDAVDFHGLKARQVLVSNDESNHPRLSETPSKLPLIKMDQRLYDSILGRKIFDGRKVIHTTNRNSAMILMSPMRDANTSGPALRKVHRRVGWYLANEFISNLVGIEEYEIPHVQGGSVAGYRLRYEEETLIVPLMRGGEPMAFGVSDAFPRAWFVHAKAATDLKPEHLKCKQTVILVDSVVNEGTSVMEFVDHIRRAEQPSIRIVVVTGVAQAKSVTDETRLGKTLQEDDGLSLVALRLSDNKYKGKGTTDTGHRLFNTTALD